MPEKVWTNGQHAKIGELWLAGVCMDEIARAVGVTHGSLKHYLRLHPQPKRPQPRRRVIHKWTERQNARLRELWSTDMPRYDIAKKLHITVGVMHHHARLLRLPKRAQAGLKHGERNKHAVSVLTPRNGNFDSRAALDRLLERWVA